MSKKARDLDFYEWHLVGYATVGSLLFFFLNDWIDSHASEFYRAEYGAMSKFFFVLPAMLNLVILFTILRKLKVTRTNVALAPVLAALTVFCSQFAGFCGFSFKTMHLPLLVVNALMAAIIGFGAWADYHSQWSIPNYTLRQAEREYETRVKLFGELLQASTLLIVSGGIGIIVALTTGIEVIGLVPETRKWWPIGTVIYLAYLAYGVYCLFLMRLLYSTGELNDLITEKEQADSTRNSRKPKHEKERNAIDKPN